MLQWVFRKRDRDREYEEEKIARLENAERDLRDLKDRGERAKRFLSERQERNHWGESVAQMIQGRTP